MQVPRYSSCARSRIFLSILGIAFLLLGTSTRLFSQVRNHHEVEDREAKGSREGFEKEGDPAARAKYFYDRLHSGDAIDVEASQAAGLQHFLSLPNYHITHAKGASVLAAPSWKQLGGSQDNINGGRATGIAFDPTNKNIIYLATAQGGLWKTVDHGAHWVNLSDDWASIVMGAVAVDPNNPKVIYAGTGDADNPQGPTGVGIYKSTDGGLNWQLIAPKGIADSRTFQIVIDGHSPLINGQSSVIYQTGGTGVRKSTDCGATWKTVSSRSGVTSFAIDPLHSDTIYLASTGGILRSTNAGEQWKQVGANITNGSRITLAICANDPSTLYASVSTSAGLTQGLAKSTNYGLSWSYVNQVTDYLGQQGWYANAVAVNPSNPNEVFVGGLDAYRSIDGGEDFQAVTDWTTVAGAPNYIHADLHVLAFNGPDEIFALTDGGIHYSTDHGATWRQDMNSISTLQFVEIDGDPDMNVAVGGCQDNGVNRVVTTNTSFNAVGLGDGGHTQISQADPQKVYSTYYSVSLRRSDDGGVNWVGGGANLISNNQLWTEGSPFYMNICTSPFDGNIVTAASNANVFLSTDGGENFEPITDGFDTSRKIIGGPNVVKLSTADPQTVWVGSRTRKMYFSTDLGTTWNKSSLLGVPSAIATVTSDKKVAYVCFSGQGTKHFAYTTNSGATWNMPDTNLPDISANAIAVGPHGELFLGNDFGVLFSLDTGKSWWPLRQGLPLVQVTSLQVRGLATKYLLAGTYGRGAYTIDLTNIAQVPLEDPTRSVAAQKSIAAASIHSIYPNPVTGKAKRSIVQYEIVKSGEAEIAIYDALGRKVMQVTSSYMKEGIHTIPLAVDALPQGRYFVALTTDGSTSLQPLVIE